MSFITIHNVWKNYGQTPVLENIHKEVEQGSFITLVGASGCGKSTFLKMLLGIEKPSKGNIILEDEPLKAEPDGERGIVFQRYSVFPHLTVQENILIALEFQKKPLIARMFGSSKQQALQKVNALIERVGLTHAMNHYPHELSGGMQQRLAIAQALIANPKVLLLDEPFGALDPGIRNDMHELVKELWQQDQLTIFMVTHDLKEAFSLGSRLWVFDKVRHDPHAPQNYGSQITYDLELSTDVDDSEQIAIAEEIKSTLHIDQSEAVIA
ncbi:MAG: ABC transporter ATP-binding protein [Gammaproteobacteria bacterium]|nr:ABC transporter ATP-binding protein [Gammaproteobacteria bacterium]